MDCPAAMNLGRWLEAIESSKFFDAPFESDRQSTTVIGEILQSTTHIRARIREVTIDRVGISTKRLRRCLGSSIALAELLAQDQQSQQQQELRLLAAKVGSGIRDLEEWNFEQQLFLDAERSNIAKQRAKLDELEAASIKETKLQIEEYQYKVAARVQEAVRVFRDSFLAIPNHKSGPEEWVEKANNAKRRSDSDDGLDLLPDTRSMTIRSVSGWG